MRDSTKELIELRKLRANIRRAASDLAERLELKVPGMGARKYAEILAKEDLYISKLAELLEERFEESDAQNALAWLKSDSCVRLDKALEDLRMPLVMAIFEVGTIEPHPDTSMN